MRVVIVCGGRDYADRSRLESFLDKTIPSCLVLIEGGANGADALARRWAKSRGVHVATVPAQWERLGKRAGPYRNIAMLRLKPDAVIAFPGGSGTSHMVEAAVRAGVPVLKCPQTTDAKCEASP